MSRTAPAREVLPPAEVASPLGWPPLLLLAPRLPDPSHTRAPLQEVVRWRPMHWHLSFPHQSPPARLDTARSPCQEVLDERAEGRCSLVRPREPLLRMRAGSCAEAACRRAGVRVLSPGREQLPALWQRWPGAQHFPGPEARRRTARGRRVTWPGRFGGTWSWRTRSRAPPRRLAAP